MEQRTHAENDKPRAMNTISDRKEMNYNYLFKHRSMMRIFLYELRKEGTKNLILHSIVMWLIFSFI